MDIINYFNRNPDKTIETMLSRVFFFGDKVYKIYKWEKAFYGDLSESGYRKKFIAEDFFWNNTMCPDIYTKLLPLKYVNEKWQEVSSEDADEFVIMMNKLKNQETFTDFAEKEPNFDVLKNLVEKIVMNQRKIADFQKEELSVLLGQDLKEIEKQEIEDLRDWAYMAQSRIPKEKTDAVVRKLFSIIELPEYQNWCGKAVKSACIDANGDNIIIDSGNVLFIDVLPPKPNWKVEDEVYNIGRMAADLSALSGKEEYAEFLYDAYAKLTNIEVPKIVRDLYEIEGAMIQAAYRAILNQREREKKYLDFVEKRI
jgi:aminoglycoside phosphotransferase family enzyme